MPGGNVVPYSPVPDGYIGLEYLQQYADERYPNDTNLARWTWQILLRDSIFFKLMYWGFFIMGRPYELDVRHRVTGQTRKEWIKDADDPYELLSTPEMWLISIESLQMESHKLYVHDEHWRCPDAVNHDNYRYMIPAEYAENHISRLTSLSEIDNWQQQARVQGVNPCVYSFITWWVTIRLQYACSIT